MVEACPESVEDFAFLLGYSSTDFSDAYLRRSTLNMQEWTYMSVEEVENVGLDRLRPEQSKVMDITLNSDVSWLVKEMREYLFPFTTLLFNKSLITGSIQASKDLTLVIRRVFDLCPTCSSSPSGP